MSKEKNLMNINGKTVTTTSKKRLKRKRKNKTSQKARRVNRIKEKN